MRKQSSPSLRKKTFGVRVFGCKVSQFEAEQLSRFLECSLGLDKVPLEERPDIVCVHTCTVTKKTDTEIRKFIRKLKRERERLVIVTGCYAERASEELYEAGADYVYGHRTRNLYQRIARALGMKDQDSLDEFLTGYPASGRTRFYLKVHDGCDVHCRFCIVPYVRGESRSVPLSVVEDRFRKLLQAGGKEIILTGVNMSAYGRDHGIENGLFHLCQRLVSFPGRYRIRLSSLGAFDIQSDFFDFVCTHPKIAPHFHIPIQSGSQRILEKMNRPYTIEQVYKILEKIRSYGDTICIGTDLIAGFPYETEYDFEQTVTLLRDAPIDYAHVFPYSPREGTPAFEWPELPHHVVQERAKILREISQQKREFFYRRQENTWAIALTLTRWRDGFRAITGNYIDIHIPDSTFRSNEFIRVQFGETDNNRPRLKSYEPIEDDEDLFKAHDFHARGQREKKIASNREDRNEDLHAIGD